MTDREELRKAAASRRSDSTVERASTAWHCAFCLRDFQTEPGLMNHHCKERERLELLKSPTGQAAYGYYSEWMRLHKRSVPPQEKFLDSRQFNHFVKFVDWAEKTAIPNPHQFIKLMVDSNTLPVMWCRDTTFMLYLQWYDNAYPPEQQFIETFDYLKRIAAEEKILLCEVFEHFTAFEMASLIRRRKLSPWLLVLSPKFLKWLQTLPPHELDVVNEAVNFNAFSQKLRDRPDLAREFRRACESEAL